MTINILKKLETKEKILQKSLELFNLYGSDNVTVRQIAKELNMSHGNLCYHYASTDDIVQALYMLLVADLDALILRGKKAPDISLESVVLMSKMSFEKLYEYRFILLDFVHIMRRIPSIKAHYRQLTVMRQLQFQFIVSELVRKGIFKQPIIENQYSHWIQSTIFFGDFWLSSAEILYQGKEQDKIATYHNFFIHLTVPYLTELGLSEIKAFF